tara:strand:+ start:320 stop:961 length:642 start_codon:yes stop_codon:yes gene_type:complete
MLSDFNKYMKKIFAIILLFLTLSSSVLANKIFNSSLGYRFEIPKDYVKYTRSYLEENMQDILLQSAESGLDRTEEFLLNQMSKFEELVSLDQFVNKNNIADSITFYLMENIPTLTDEEIKKDRDEIEKITAETNGFGDYEFTTFEVFTISVDGKKGHRMIYNLPNQSNYLMSDTWLEFNNENNLRITSAKNNTDFESFNSFIEEIDSSINFRQ